MPSSGDALFTYSRRTRLPWLILTSIALAGCPPAETVQHRDRAADRDKECAEPRLPHAYFYPAKNRTDYGPDDPKKDGCVLLVPDHLFCCPAQ